MAEELSTPSGPWLFERARRDPDAVALVTANGTLRWRDLAARVAVLADRFVALGLASGDRLAVLMEPSCRLIEIVHAAQRCRIALVLLNTRLAPPEIAVLVAHSEPAVLLYDRAHEACVTDMKGQARPRVIEGTGELDAVVPGVAPPLVAVDPAALQTILYTSGTTGRPKGVMLTHGNHRASAAESRAHLGTRANDRWLGVLPLHHVGGLSIVMRSVLDGTPLVLHERFVPAAVWNAFDRDRITLLSLVPTMLHRLLEENAGAQVPSTLRCVLVGGAALAPELHARARARGIPVVPTYGLTEAASQIATAALGQPALDAGCVGWVLSPTRVRIACVDERGRGEVLVAGSTVMAGYFRDPDATATALRDGWLHTGDIGRLDAEGRLQILDRRSDVVITGGENVYPTEVERVLVAHDAILEAAVYGVPDPEWGKRVQAAVVVRDGHELDEAALQRWCRGRLAGYKIPRRFVRVPTLPRTASGKLRRHVLGFGG